MAENNHSEIEEIGATAGRIWGFLNDNGGASLNKLAKNLEVSRELALQSVGWLAREDKIVFEPAARGRLIRLK